MRCVRFARLLVQAAADFYKSGLLKNVRNAILEQFFANLLNEKKYEKSVQKYSKMVLRVGDL